MENRLETILKRYNELTELLASQEVLNDFEKLKTYSKEQKDLEETVNVYKEYKKAKEAINDAKLLLNDPELKDMAQMELDDNTSKLEELTNKLEILLIPKDENDGKNVIMEGRDIGTVIFPNADVKIYLDANVEVRAKRRYEENVQNGINTTYEEVLENVKMRDYNDMHKKVGALKKADDAIIIDSTTLTIDQVVENIKKLLI